MRGAMLETNQKITTREIEIAVARYFNPRVNLVVPNVSWGLALHECDLLVLTASQYLYEVEIKTTKSDLKADLKKRHGHNSRKIKKLYFAIPDYLLDCEDLIPERAGILTIWKNKYDSLFCSKHREASINSNYKCSDRECFEFARLGALRIFGLIENIDNLVKDKAAIYNRSID
jgi:hypothetical protein